MKIFILSLLVCLLLSVAAADISVFRTKRGPGFGPPMRRPPPPPPPKFGKPGFRGPGPKGGPGKTTVIIIKKG
uniref:Uncharacterized protein n=1 Tax=Panagrolaimus superbus TaxID=310955 RepID=A0A914ZAU7_9BILA